MGDDLREQLAEILRHVEKRKGGHFEKAIESVVALGEEAKPTLFLVVGEGVVRPEVDPPPDGHSTAGDHAGPGPRGS